MMLVQGEVWVSEKTGPDWPKKWKKPVKEMHAIF